MRGDDDAPAGVRRQGALQPRDRGACLARASVAASGTARAERGCQRTVSARPARAALAAKAGVPCCIHRLRVALPAALPPPSQVMQHPVLTCLAPWMENLSIAAHWKGTWCERLLKSMYYVTLRWGRGGGG